MSLVIALAVFGQWSGNGIIAYYLKLVLDSVDIKSPSDQLGVRLLISPFLPFNYLPLCSTL